MAFGHCLTLVMSNGDKESLDVARLEADTCTAWSRMKAIDPAAPWICINDACYHWEIMHDSQEAVQVLYYLITGPVAGGRSSAVRRQQGFMLGPMHSSLMKVFQTLQNANEGSVKSSPFIETAFVCIPFIALASRYRLCLRQAAFTAGRTV